MAGVAGGGVHACGFGAVHSEGRRFAEAADDQARAARGPLGQRGADDGLVCGGAGDVLKGKFGLGGNDDGGDESLRAEGQEFAHAQGCG